MKKILMSALIIMAVMLLMPVAVMQDSPKTAFVNANVKIPKIIKDEKDTFLVCNTKTGETSEISREDYIFGVVAAEMPALYETEALKAQAVAAYTYACRRKAENSEKSYDITSDPTTDQSFITEEEARERWGDKADEYCKKIRAAIEEVKEYILTYGGEPALTVYHAISSGMTENCSDVWGKEIPYLTAVSSPGDKLSPDYIKEVKIKAETVSKKLSEECEIKGAAADYFGKAARTKSGAVKEIEVCGTKLKGARIRSIFDLRSDNFEVSFKDGEFTFKTYGYGHGVGMSQYGANYMAKQGSDFKEILSAYYKGCKLEKE